MKKLIIAAFAALALVGCASTNYDAYAKSHADVANTRIVGLTKIAESGDPSTKAAVAMAIALTSNNLQAPQNEALQWAQVLSPLAGQAIQGFYGLTLGIRQSDNAVKTEGIRWGTMSNIAGAGIEAAGKVEQVKPCIITEAVIQC